MREAALTDAVASLEKELDALADEREEMQLVREGLEAQVQQAGAVEHDLKEQLVARDATMVAMQAELDASEEARVELAKRVDAMEVEGERARQAAPADRPGPRPAGGDDDESKRRPARGDGGVVEVVRHRSDVGNRL
jgi:chromosome segregation ATPase